MGSSAAGIDGPSWDAAKQFNGGGGKLIGDDDVHDSVCQYNVVFC